MDNEEFDVSTDSSPEVEQQSAAPEESSNDSSDAAPEQREPAVKEPAPFHEHPRFKELIEEKNGFKQQLEAQSRQFADMQRQLEQFQKASQPKPQDALMERLKGIDPEFADRFGKLNEVDQLKTELQEFRSWQQEMRDQAVQREAVSVRDKFYADNNVPADDRDLYNDLLVAKNPQTLKELPAVLKQVHETLSKRLASAQRQATKQLVEGKKADAARPATQPKGTPVKHGQKNDYSADPREARSQLIKDVMADMKAGKDI